MANAVYPVWKQELMQHTGNTDLDQAAAASPPVAPSAILVDLADYTYNAAHDFLDDIDGLSPDPVVAAGVEIGSATFANGTFDGADVTFSTVSGDTVEAIVIYRATGSSATARLVLYLDTSVTGLPLTPNGGDVTISWNVSGIFTLSDRRVKENIREVGHLNSLVGVYEYNYVGLPFKHRGVIAQEVERVLPAAVRDINGLKRVDLNRTIAFAAAA